VFCEKILPPSHVRAHLLQYGFKPNYTVWVQHGEEMSSEDNVGNIGSMTNMVNDAYMQEADITSHYGHMDNEDEYVEESPNAEAQMFYDMLAAANEPIYDGATESKLSVGIRLLVARMNWHTPEKCLDHFIKLLVDVAPKDNCIPKTRGGALHSTGRKSHLDIALGLASIFCCIRLNLVDNI